MEIRLILGMFFIGKILLSGGRGGACIDRIGAVLKKVNRNEVVKSR